MKSVHAKRFLGAAVFLLLSGCDYWEGLIGDKAVSKADLAITFLDTWTNAGLPGVVCNEATRNLNSASDDMGISAFASTGTGEYRFACSVPYYYDTTFELKVAKGVNAHAIRLARKGGEDWYPDAERMVRIYGATSTVRFPRNLAWSATPYDTTGKFRFEWTFKTASRLSHVPGPGELPGHFLKPWFEDRATAAVGVTAGPDTVCLKVYSRLRGKQNEYLVGGECVPFVWAQNQLPSLTLEREGGDRYVRSGCSGPAWVGGSVVRVKFTAIDPDPDGTCDSVRFYSKVNSAFGKVDTVLTCEEGQLAEFPLQDPFGSRVRPDSTLELANFLYATAYDDNQETTEDTLKVITVSNRVPVSSAGLLNPQSRYFVNDSVRIWAKGTDGDGPIEAIQIQWEPLDPHILTPDTSFQTTFRKETYHIYRKAGTYKISVDAIDNCPDTANFGLPPLIIYENAKPIIKYASPSSFPSGQTTVHQFLLSLQDKDVDDSLDRFELITINWGDGTAPDSTTLATGARYENKNKTHTYGGPPPAGASAYKINIVVRDAHHGVTDSTFAMPY